MEEIFHTVLKVFVEPTQIVLFAWIAVCHYREREERSIQNKLQDVIYQQKEVLAGMSKTIDLIMDKIIGGR